MNYIFEIAFGLMLLFVLYKMNVIKLPARIFLRHKYSAKKLTLKYLLFNNGYRHNFLLKEGKSYTMHYEVNLEKGSVTIRLQDVFEKTFHNNETSTVQFKALSRIQGIFVEGDRTKGHCKIEMKEVA